jgi:hypothetical protein
VAGENPGWTTVPAQDDSGWQLYRPTPAPVPVPQAAAQPPTAPAAPPATTPSPRRADQTPKHQAGARHRRHTETPATRIVVKPEPTGAVLAVPPTHDAPGYASALVLAALVTAIACLGSASAPTSQIRWRRDALFVADNRVGITSAGAACLLAAAILFVLARA